MSYLIGHKENMTQVFDGEGRVFPVTVIKLAPTEASGLEVKEGDLITISGTSKGKGFQGVVKRHGFAGGPRTHGQKHSEREPGAIGGSGGRAGGRVAKGIRMAGRMGGDRVTRKNVKVVRVDTEERKLYLSGAIPGRRGSKVEIKNQNAKGKSASEN